MFKRIISVCLLCIVCIIGYAQSNGNGEGGFDPVTPDDPQMPEDMAWLNVETNPRGAGMLEFSRKKIVVGDSIWMVTYPNSGYKFEKWMCNGEVVSMDQFFYFEMLGKETKLTAYFTYDPTTPDDPTTPETQHMLSLTAEPLGSCNFDNNEVKISEGATQLIYAYVRSGYRFKCWKRDGRIISESNPMQYVMGTTRDELTAICEYNPDTPIDPNVNYWNDDTGEAIIDRFERGNLWYTLYNKTGNDLGAVRDLTVAGGANSSDIYIMWDCSQLETIDLSRTYGYSDIPNNAANSSSSLKKVILPSCVESISGEAFYGCRSLEELQCYATTPPVLSNSALLDVDTMRLVIRVPASALLLYRNADVWKDFDIQPMEQDVRSIRVNLPEESGQYKNMIIQLTNEASGQSYRYVVNDRISYVFNNLLKSTSYTAQLKTQQNVVLASINNIQTSEVAGGPVVVTFTDIKRILTASVKILTPLQQDVTSQVSISWLDADGKNIKQGAEVTGIVEGTQLTYTITLPQSLAMEYKAPDAVTFKADTEEAALRTVSLCPFDSIWVHGVVKDGTGKAISAAVVTISQRIAGLYPNTSVVEVSDKGEFSVKVLIGTLSSGEAWGEATITATASDYVANTVKVSVENLSAAQEIVLKPITGATLNLSFTYQHAAEPSQTPVVDQGYSDYSNIAYTLYNVTQGKEITNFSSQYPRIVLLEGVANGDRIKVIASSRNEAFASVEGECVITENNSVQSADIQLHIVGRGCITATYLTTDNAGVVAVLYDKNGEFIKKISYADKAVKFNDLQDGAYHLLSMAESDMFNDFQRLSSLDNAGLKNLTDYVINDVTVNCGVVTAIVNQIVPFFDVTKVYYTGTNTGFTVNKASITAGNYLTMKAVVDFRTKFQDEINNLKLLVDLPSSCNFVANSLMFGDSVSTASTIIDENNRLLIPLDSYTQVERTIRFCIDPTQGGDFAPSAFVQFSYNGKIVLQPIGNAPFTVKDLTIEVPSKSGKIKVPVSGTAKRGAEVSVYDGEVLLSQTTALANGSWSTIIELQNPEFGSEHTIYAKVGLSDGTALQTETKTLIYDKSLLVIDDVHMYHNNPEMWRTYDIVFDFQNPKNRPGNYIYYIYNRVFTFKVDIEGTPCDDLALVVTTAKDKKKTLKVEYDPKKDYYYASGEFGNYYDGDLPVNVAISDCNLGVVSSGNVDAGFGIDPSGYVYEAVHSNRVQGVKATAYYREKVMVADPTAETGERWTGEYTEQIWNAEEYAQENPLFTDENGMYRWDVPIGEWQVRFEKEGFQNTQSEWLPVPPPQLEINVPITSTAVPAVSSVNAYEDAVEVEFDRYMDPSSMSILSITLQKLVDGGEDVDIIKNITLVNPEDGYCKKIRIETNQTLLATDKVNLTISKTVRSYAGIQLDEDYTQEFSVKKEVKEISVAKNTNVIYNPYVTEQPKVVTVGVSPYDAAIGKTMKAVSSSDMVVTSTPEAVIDNNGQATFTLTGQMLGFATITFAIDGEAVTGSTEVNVTREARKVDSPVAKGSGAVYHNSNIVLSCGTKEAKIYYTVDGSDPTSESIEYTEPIKMEEAKTIKAIGICDGYDNSDVVEFSYTVKKSNGGFKLSDGWNWISHNLEGEITYNDLLSSADDIKRIVGQYAELINDPSWGLVGNLSTLTNEEAYKIEMKACAQLGLNGYEANALETPISLNVGWNWIGYPVAQITTLDEAFKYATPSDGDVIVTIDGGQAEFDGTKWTGDLKSLTPGVGYQYNAHKAMTFMYNINLVSNANARYAIPISNQTPWSCNVHKYPNVMCVVADVIDNGTQVQNGAWYVAAFAGDECRGIGSWQSGKMMITVHGNGGEQIIFRACKAADVVASEYSITETMTFGENLMGSLSAPVQLTIGQATGIESIPVSESNVSGNCFDLTGRQINAKSARGVYIQSGKKYVVR